MYMYTCIYIYISIHHNEFTTASVEMEKDLDSSVLNDFVPESYFKYSRTNSTPNVFGAVFVCVCVIMSMYTYICT